MDRYFIKQAQAIIDKAKLEKKITDRAMIECLERIAKLQEIIIVQNDLIEDLMQLQPNKHRVRTLAFLVDELRNLVSE